MGAAGGDDDPAPVGVGDVVEAEKLPRTPANQRASDLVEHGLDLDVVRRKSRGNAEELIAGFSGLEVSGGPRNEIGRWDWFWLTCVHETAFCVDSAVQGTTRPQKSAQHDPVIRDFDSRVCHSYPRNLTLFQTLITCERGRP